MNNKVSVGITSIVGWLSALAALSPAAVKALETGQADWNGPEKYLAIFGIASGLITQIARYLQAHKLITLNFSAATSAEREFEQNPSRLESARKPDGPREQNVDVSPAPISATHEVPVAGV